jgi:hypothetical protein
MDLECSEKAKKKWCPFFRFEDGFVDIISIAILLGYLVLVTISQQHIADSADLREQTAQDYTIVRSAARVALSIVNRGGCCCLRELPTKCDGG